MSPRFVTVLRCLRAGKVIASGQLEELLPPPGSGSGLLSSAQRPISAPTLRFRDTTEQPPLPLDHTQGRPKSARVQRCSSSRCTYRVGHPTSSITRRCFLEVLGRDTDLGYGGRLIMLQSIFIIARRILRDAIHNRLLLIGLVFTLIISGFAAMAAAVSMGEHTRLVVDVGLSATSFLEQ